MNVSDEDIENLLVRARCLLKEHAETSGSQSSSALQSFPDSAIFSSFSYLPRQCQDKQLGVIYAIIDLGFHEKFSISLETLSNFILRVQKGYRDNPYHDWTHAFAVFHFAYAAVKNLPLVELLGSLACFSFIIAALCHDLDHRGTNSAFEISVQSPLSSLYSSKGSVMERHHFAQTITLLNISGCNVFSSMQADENQQALDYIKQIILATDLAQHLRIMADLEILATKCENGESIADLLKQDDVGQRYQSLVLSLLMTTSDISDQAKDWKTTKTTAGNIYEEFFNQGDQEKDMGLQPKKDMDRELACVPAIQVSFNNHIVSPAYSALTRIFPMTKPILDRVLLNRERWKIIATEWEKLNKPAKASIEILTNDFDRDVLGKLSGPVNPFA